MNTKKRCAGCKYLRKKCPWNCIFSPYFPPNHPQRFAFVHKNYGASNVAKMLQQIPVQLRGETAESLYQEAECRIRDPVYGCAGIISRLHNEICHAQRELAMAQAEISILRSSCEQVTIMTKSPTPLSCGVDLTSCYNM